MTTTADTVTVPLWPWLEIEIPRDIWDMLSEPERADCEDAARCEVVRLLRLRAGGPLGGGVS